MNPNSKQFLKLQKQWYKKLEKNGFEDIEYAGGNSMKSGAQTRFSDPVQSNTVTRVESKTDYYRIAGFFLYDYTFQDVYDKRVWELHAEGVTIRATDSILIDEGFQSYRDKVGKTLKRLKAIMLEKYGVVKHGQ